MTQALSKIGLTFPWALIGQRGGTFRVTKRQREILELSAQGLTEKEVADRLGITLPTVRTHLQRFYRANGLRNKAEAIGFWVKHSNL